MYEQPLIHTSDPSVCSPALQSLLHTAMLHFKPEVYKQLLAHTHFPEEGPEEAAQRWRSVAVSAFCYGALG